MITVVHWINLNRLYRSHLSFKDTEFIKNYFIIDSAQSSIDFGKSDRIFVGDPRNPNFLESFLKQISPDVVICANLIDAPLMKLVRQYCRYFIYVNHSVWNQQIIKTKIIQNKKENLVSQYSVFDSLYVLPTEANMWISLGLDSTKIIPTHGLTFLDPIFQQNQSLNKLNFQQKYHHVGISLKYILLIHNSSSSGCLLPNGQSKTNLQNSEDYALILESLINFAASKHIRDDLHIITKIGRRRDTLVETDLIKKLHQSKFVTVIWPESHQLMSEFLFADIVLIQGFSTAYVEALLVNHRAIPFYLNGKILLNQQKYPHLPIINQIENLYDILNYVLSNEFDDSQLIKDEISEMIFETFGSYQIENVTNKIIADLNDIFKNVHV